MWYSINTDLGLIHKKIDQLNWIDRHKSTPFCQQKLLTNQQLALPENWPIFVAENRTLPIWRFYRPIASDDKNRPISHERRPIFVGRQNRSSVLGYSSRDSRERMIHIFPEVVWLGFSRKSADTGMICTMGHANMQISHRLRLNSDTVRSVLIRYRSDNHPFSLYTSDKLFSYLLTYPVDNRHCSNIVADQHDNFCTCIETKIFKHF